MVGRLTLSVWSISLLAHLVVLTLALVWVEHSARSPGDPPDRLGQSEIVLQLPEHLEPLDENNKAPGIPAPDKLAGIGGPTATPSKSLDDPLQKLFRPATDLPFPAEPGKPLDDRLDVSLPKTSLPAGTVPGVGDGGTKIFGVNDPGGTPETASVVYVIDRSASMHSALPIAKKELLADLARLDEKTRFQVVFYRDVPDLMTLDRQTALVAATAKLKQEVARQLAGIPAEGGTDHVAAIRKAISLRPEVIYCITDADELKPAQVRELTTLNQGHPKPARIHCIELSLLNRNNPDTPLRQLARSNGGKYQGIDLNQFLKPPPNRP